MKYAQMDVTHLVHTVLLQNGFKFEYFRVFSFWFFLESSLKVLVANFYLQILVFMFSCSFQRV